MTKKSEEWQSAVPIIEEYREKIIERHRATADALTAMRAAIDVVPHESRHALSESIRELNAVRTRLIAARTGIGALRTTARAWISLRRQCGEAFESAVTAILGAWQRWVIDDERRDAVTYTRRALNRDVGTIMGQLARLSNAWNRTPSLSDIRLIDLLPDPVPDTLDCLDEPLPRAFDRLAVAVNRESEVVRQRQTIPSDTSAGIALAYHLTYNLHVATQAVAHAAIAEIASTLSGEQVAETALRRAWDRSLQSNPSNP
jgi:hypothetical protein